MCTLVLLHRCVPGRPVVVAANRDEYLDRPAQGPQLRLGPGGLVLAPLDVRAGGTWLGLNRHGLFAGITNRPVADPDPARRSRGLLVMDALAAPTAAEAAERLARLPESAYNPFNLLVADDEQAFVVRYQDRAEVAALAPGAHVVGNADVDDRQVPKVARILGRAEAAAGEPPERVLPALAALLRDHVASDNPLEETCIHTPRYGTRSSTLLSLAVGPDSGSTLRFADGPPCLRDYDDFTPLLRELGRQGRVATGDTAARSAS